MVDEKLIAPKRKHKPHKPHRRKHQDVIAANLNEIIDMAGRGMCQRDIALCLGIPDSTFSKNKALDEKLSNALKIGKAKGINTVSAMFFENIKAGNIKAQIFYLKTQAKWQERILIAMEDPLAIPDPNSPIDDEKAQQTYFSRLKQLRPDD